MTLFHGGGGGGGGGTGGDLEWHVACTDGVSKVWS